MKLFDFGDMSDRLRRITTWHLVSGLMNSLASSFTMVFITNYMITNIAPAIQATRGLLETVVMLGVMMVIGNIHRQQKWMRSIYWWVAVSGLLHSGILLLLTSRPEFVCIGYGIIVNMYVVINRLESYSINLVFRGENRTALENCTYTASIIGAIGGSILAILFKDMGIWTAIILESSLTIFIWIPSVFINMKLVFNEIDRQGGVTALAERLKKEA